MSKPKTKLKFMAAAIAAATLSQASLTTAQVLEEVIVTAQLRAESLQDVPLSVNAISGDKMMEAGIDKIEDLQAYVPNFTMSETGIGTNIYIRGIGSGINQGFEQSVGMYIDGVYHGRAQLARAPFLDLERVEVLRGPQSILFGKNSIAGALNITTAKPTDEFEGMVSALYEPEHNEQVYDLMLSGGITDTLAGRVAYRNRSMDGFVDNKTLGEDEPERDEETFRGILQWDPTDSLQVTFKAEHSEFETTGRQVEIFKETQVELNDGTTRDFYADQLAAAAAPGVIPGLSNTKIDGTRSANGDSSDNEMDTFALTFDYMIGDYTLTAITGYLSYDYDELCDCDFTGAPLFTVNSDEEYDQFSQEIRITSPVGETFEYITGVYYQTSELDFNDRFVTPTNTLIPVPTLVDIAANREFEQDSDLYSAFAQVTWNISDVFRLTLGGRYSYEEKEGSRDLQFVDGTSGAPLDDLDMTLIGILFKAENHSLADERDESNFAPLAILEYDLSDDVMFYASASQGFKSGGYDARSNSSPEESGSVNTAPRGTFDYDEEEATSFEIGAKTTLLDGRAELNAAVFYTEYDDLQISIFDGTLGFNVGNAAEAVTQGIELDGRIMLTESLTLIGSLAFLDFEWENFENGQCTQSQRLTDTSGQDPLFCDYDGESNQYVADWSGAITADYRQPIADALMFTAILDVIFTDDYSPTQNLDPVIDQDGYAKVNARLALGGIDGDWEVALIGRNLTDEEIVTYANDTPLAASAIYQTTSYYGFVERERNIAIQGTYRF